MRVLLIEDDPSLATFFSRALVRAGYQVTSASRGDDGFATILHSPPELLVVDWYLPGKDGISIVRDARAHGFEGPILMLSGSGPTAREDALDAGANAFLAKPCGLEELTNCVAMLTGRLLVRNLSASAA